ncbi:MAG: hypothetical protein AAB546_03960 [Patescibacteria group bacterium]
MKKYLPIALFVLGLVVFTGVYFFVIKGKNNKPVEVEDVVAEIPFDQRPVTTLTPFKDGHWLKLSISSIKVKASTLDYELLYQTQEGAMQGVPGSIKLEGSANIERELLLGSESSGKFRYDEGVETGTLTLRFRNEKGKLIGKLSTKFHLQEASDEITSDDGKFKFKLTKKPKSGFFLTMDTFGIPGVTTAPSSGPYGIFTDNDSVSGEPEGQWTKVTNPNGASLGIFYR